MPEEDDEQSILAGQTPDLRETVAGLRDVLSHCDLQHIGHDDGGELPKRKNIVVLTSAINAAGIDGEALVRYGLVWEQRCLWA